MPNRLTSLLAAGRRHSSADVGMLQSIHDNVVQLGATCGEQESDPLVHAGAAFLEALQMSHGDLANLLRTALKGEYPGQNTYVWTRDVYDDVVVYELNTNDQTMLYQRSYSILDGAVTFGDPVKVVAVTQYVAVEEAERMDEAIDGIVAWLRKHGGAHPHAACTAKFGNDAICAKAVDQLKGTTKWRGGTKESADPADDGDLLTEREFSQEERDKLAKSGEAMSDGAYPITNKRDLRNAIRSYGRGGSKANVKAHIIKRAKALDAEDMLPEDWQESAVDELIGDLVPLTEKAVKNDGTIAIKIIQPGQGSSGYYSPEVLKRDGPKVFTKGLHMYADHPSLSEESDRPERSIKDLVGTLTSDATWEDEGAAGPGLYAEAKVRGDVAPLIEELAPSIGVSIRALGKASAGEVDGKKVRVIEGIEQAKSVDFVTVPGAGGRVLDLIESARNRAKPTEVTDMAEQQLNELEEAKKELDALKAWKEAQERREAEAKLIAEARAIVVKQLAGIALPEITKGRLTEQLASDPPATADGALDVEALTIKVTEAAKVEAEYLAAVAGAGRITGMGGAAPTEPDADAARKRLAASFVRMGMSESAAERAAAGR